MICDLIKYLKTKKLTLYSVPGGEKISIGGAISANVIGKDSSKNVACFGDTIKYLEIVRKAMFLSCFYSPLLFFHSPLLFFTSPVPSGEPYVSTLISHMRLRFLGVFLWI